MPKAPEKFIRQKSSSQATRTYQEGHATDDVPHTRSSPRKKGNKLAAIRTSPRKKESQLAPIRTSPRKKESQLSPIRTPPQRRQIQVSPTGASRKGMSDSSRKRTLSQSQGLHRSSSELSKYQYSYLVL